MQISNRLNQALAADKKLLSIYFTAGYPRLDSTAPICRALERAGVDLIEIGIPFSDPVADGRIIQHSSRVALENGMSLERLFQQLKDIRSSITLPLILMGYFNPILRFGLEAFCARCRQVGIDGLIIPDLPLEEFQEKHQSTFLRHGLHNIFLITPSSSPERIRLIDGCSTAFIYAVSSAATTGGRLAMTEAREHYLSSLQAMRLKHPVLVGFGISDRESFAAACAYSKGAIVGSAFIRAIETADNLEETSRRFVEHLRGTVAAAGESLTGRANRFN